MKRFPLLAAVACLVTVTGSAGAGSHLTPRCHEVDADFTSALTTEDCSPTSLCAAGAIKHDRLLRGPMFVSVDHTAPSAGLPGIEPPSTLSVSGVRTLTPHRGGTLIAHVVGIFDTAAVVFNEINEITSGTGRFAGATGRLHVVGQAVAPGKFAGEIRGQICLP